MGLFVSVALEASEIAGQGLGHRGVGEPLVADADEVAPLSGKALALEQRPGGIAGVDGQALCAARLREPRQRLDQRAARALASEFGIDEQHVDLVGAFEAGEAGDRAVDHSEQGQAPGPAGRRKPVRHRRARPRPRAALRRSRRRRAHRCSSERSRRSVARRPADRGEARRRSPLRLPGRGAILVVFDGDPERGEPVAKSVGLGPILCRARTSRVRRRSDRRSRLLSILRV